MKTHLKIEGMSCQHCQQAVERCLSRVAGATEVTVDLSAHAAWVSGSCDPEALRQAVEEAGFEVGSVTAAE